MSITSFHPPYRLLLGPGPSMIHPRVSAAQSKPMIGHLDPACITMMDEIKELLYYAFQTKNALTLPLSAPGSAGMESCFVNLIEPGDKVIVCRNGVFGARMKENADRLGAKAIMVEDDWGKPVDLEKVRKTFQENSDVKALAFVHAETSTGVRSDVEALCRLAKEFNALSIVDAVTSLGGIELKVDEWGVDACYSGTQKCLSAPPGISPITYSEQAASVIKNRKSKVPSWFLDKTLIMGHWEGEARRYHHTVPVSAFYSLHESLVMLQEEGLENCHARHLKAHQMLKAGATAMGLKFLVDEEYQLPQLNSIVIPEGVDDAAVRKKLLASYQIEIGAGLGDLAGKVWRIGLMGESCRIQNILLFLHALEHTLIENGYFCQVGAAVKAAEEITYEKIS